MGSEILILGLHRYAGNRDCILESHVVREHVVVPLVEPSMRASICDALDKVSLAHRELSNIEGQ